MRLLVVSDVHANAPAFEAVLRDAATHSYDASLFLGDLVGYNPYPNECAALLRELAPVACLLGNHDALLLALADADDGYDSREETVVSDVIARQLDELDAGTIELLRSFEPSARGPGWQAAHGAFRQPFEYLATLGNAQANLPFLEERVGVVGHTHVPKVYASVLTDQGPLWRTVTFRLDHERYRIPPTAHAFVNPGSVGQPRDGIPAAAYALLDSERLTFEVRRVEYDVAAVQRRIVDAGYPPALGLRLGLGR